MTEREELKTKLKELRKEERECRSKIIGVYGKLHDTPNISGLEKQIESLELVMVAILTQSVKINKRLGKIKWAYPKGWHYKPLM